MILYFSTCAVIFSAKSMLIKGQDVPVKVARLADFGSFVEREEDIEALMHISEISRNAFCGLS